MNRRSFLLTGISLSTIAIVGFEWVTGKYATCAKPQLLSQLCNEETIRILGANYLKMEPSEDDKAKLLARVYSDVTDIDALSHQDVLRIQDRLESSIRSDFKNGRTVVLRGWILSLTEARQCALFSILNP